jgi:trimethylamine-N-oxide reductase (cytochrome c)
VNNEQEKTLQNQDNNESGEISRRNFLVGAGAVVIGGAAAGVGYGTSNGSGGGASTTTTTVETTKTVEKVSTVTIGDGDVVTVTKTVSEGSGSSTDPAFEPEDTFTSFMSYSVIADFDVKNGKIIRGRPTRYTEKYPDLKPVTITARGSTWTAPLKSPVSPFNMAYRKRTDSPNRVLYPLKRVDWEPGGDPAKINAQNRGISKYKRISWDEASKIIANELKRVADKYGPEAVSCVYSGGHSEGNSVSGTHGTQENMVNYWLLKNYGARGTTASGRATSHAGGQLGGRYAWGQDYPGELFYKDVAENTELLVGWAADVQTKNWICGASHQVGMIMRWYKELGIKQVYISPDVNKGVGNYADKWIPIMPSTDGALFLAIAYIWITEDTYDKDYIASHTTGFEDWRAYVMGEEDGVPKTPQWAAPICGIDVWTIKALARQWASKVTSTIHGFTGGGASCRTLYAHEYMRMEIYLLAMQAWGAPGRLYCRPMVGWTEWFRPAKAASVGGVAANSKISIATSALGVSEPPAVERPQVARDNLYECFNNPPFNWYGTGAQFTKLTYPMQGKSEIHLVWATSASYCGSRAAGFRANEAFRNPKIECHITQNMFLEDGMIMSDIILPISTHHERTDIKAAADVCGTLLLQKQAVKPRGESKSDFEAVCTVAEKLGILDVLTEGNTVEGILEARVREGYNNSGWTDVVSWEQLNENNYYAQSMEEPNWTLGSNNFYNDPVAYPLSTPSGKLEFVSTLLTENFPDDKERCPLAHYIRGGPASEGWSHNEDRLISERAADYPLLMVCNTSIWKHHSMRADIPWTREIEKVIGWDGYAYMPLYINPTDAEARGIKDGDIVKIYNERGIVLGGAVVSQKVIAGAVNMDKAGGNDHIDPIFINRGGSPNSISPISPLSDNAYGLAATGYLVEVIKVTGAEMEEWRDTYPQAFTRDYDPAYGPMFKGWIAEGGI